MDIGFIGVGAMGTQIVNLLLDAGHHLTLWARRPASVAPFRGRSSIARTPAEVAQASDVIGICVWGEDDVDEVLTGEHGVLAGIRPGAVVAIHSTISPGACQRLQATAAASGARLIDAPVSVGSRAPRLLVMVGGERSAVDDFRPALEAFGDPVLHLGPVGSGQIAKLVNNTMLAATVGLGEDAMTFGAQLGLDTSALAAVLTSGSARGTWTALLARAQERAVPGVAGRTGEWASKDVGLVESLAAESGIDLQRSILTMARRGVEVLS
jgi:3-hydroxyisobutyrate dehydrogenase-like beta-hydroxyacid dehydrogenase